MEALIRNQKIKRRRVRNDRFSRSDRPSFEFGFAGGPGAPVAALIGRFDQFTLFAFAGIALIAVLALLTLHPVRPAAPFRFTGGTIELPADENLPALLESYLDGLAEGAADGDERILPPAPTVLSTVTYSKYSVKAGDSIGSVSKKFGVSVSTIISFNRLENARTLKSGTNLRIPSQNGLSYTVRKGDSLSGIAARYGIALNALLDANNMATAAIKAGMELFIPGASLRAIDVKKALGQLFARPVNGRLTSGFGMRNDPFTGVRKFHYGIDLAVSVGTPVKAAMEGTVAMVAVDPTFGKYIIVRHSDGYQSWYAHLDASKVKAGEKVIEGQVIAESGNTGYSTGPHLHFSIFKRGTALDPLKYLY